MKERPILFNGEMVRAILDGRKTQTRRIIARQPLGSKAYPFSPKPNYDGLWSDTKDPVSRYFACPNGVAGDRLWVREAYLVLPNGARLYRSTDSERSEAWRFYGPPKWTPSIHMPRWASRITLEIVNVRVERVQEISESDAKAEGIELHQAMRGAFSSHNDRLYARAFSRLWDSIHGKGAWESNDWVWVVEFRKL